MNKELQGIITRTNVYTTSLRKQINPDNFLKKLRCIKPFFPNPIQAIICFYTLLPFWDITSKVSEARKSAPNILWLNGKNGSRSSEEFSLEPKFHQEFRDFVENHYIFTNDEIGITSDYYFSRFDEALAEHDPQYVKQHGIFFTDINLSRFALWFIREKFGEKKLSDKYIVIDPAGGSGNLISSWKRNHIKFKIVSELNPDLLKTIELRLKNDPIQVKQGYCIIPKTHENKGLNFIDKSALEYYNIVEDYVKKEGRSIDKPFAFLLNPPYKNTDENEKSRKKASSNYPLDSAILSITGQDAGKERYLAFLAQILEICKVQKQKFSSIEPILMVFTPTSWLISRPTYQNFRSIFDMYLKFEKGFMITGQEFFRGTGRWPIAFTVWRYIEKRNKNNVKLLDITDLKKDVFQNINWNETLDVVSKEMKKILSGKKEVPFDNSRGDIRNNLPKIKHVHKNVFLQQPRYDYSHAKRKEDYGKLVSGFPLKDNERHFKLLRKCGEPTGIYIGFHDDATPVRLNQDNFNRMSHKVDRVWFMLMSAFSNINKSRIQTGPADSRTFCAYDLESSKVLFNWFGLSKALNGRYPVWANQFDIWSPCIKKQFEREYYSLCFAFALSENRCVVTKFEKDNPVPGAPEVFVENPMCPTNSESFWSKTLDSQIKDKLAKTLVDEIKSLYTYWNLEYCKGQLIENCGLKDEPYFQYFDYPDFVTPYSGLVQIKKYAEVNGKADILERFENIKAINKQIKEKIYDLLINEFGYFE